MPLSDIELLRRLVGFDTTSHRPNLPLVDFLADYLAGPGVRVSPHPSADGQKATLLVQAGPDPGPERRGVVLSGHTDVVPAGDGWGSDPFVLTDRGDGRLVGRGACDMKGFLAVAANRFAAAAAGRLRAPLVLLLTYDEEVGTAGARHFVETWSAPERLPRAAVVGEPTRLRVVRAHKGIVELRVTVRGRSAHSGYPHLGQSAIEPAARIAVALAELRARLAAERPPGSGLFPDVPYVALNVGTIQGGTASNVVPERCDLVLTARPLPGGDAEALTARITDAVREAAPGVPLGVERLAESPPMETRAEAPVLRALAAAGAEADAAGASYATDAGWLQRLGLDCALYGPGDIALAHQPDEYVPVADLARAGEVLERVIRTLCA